jgi:PD-(D/E)XK nuclease superfamily/Domain of unknown function (DUF2357)
MNWMNWAVFGTAGEDVETLSIRPSGASRAWRVWPAPEPIPPGTVQEGGEHIIELAGTDYADTAELTIEGLPLRPLRCADRRTARWAWAPGFNAGRAEAQLSLGGRRIRLSLETDPAARKLARNEFDTLIQEVIEETLALLTIGGHRKGFGPGSGRPPPLARLEYLRSRAEAVTATVRGIDRHPRHSLVAEEITLPYWAARGATGTEVLRSMRSGRILHDTNDPSILPTPLRGMMPARIRKRARMSCLDLPEHRTIKACLVRWSAWLVAAAESLASAPVDKQELMDRRSAWAANLRATARSLSTLLDLPLFEGVREGMPRVEATPLFRHDPAYRDFYKLAAEMELATANIFGDFLDLPLSRTHELYELWCFLKLARAAAAEVGGTIDLATLFVPSAGGIEYVSGAAKVRAGPLTVSFQRSFKEYWRADPRIGSMSREMVPDVTISAEGSARVVAFDAKYRVGQDLNAALASAHMYRDAIVMEGADGKPESLVVGSFLLSPHVPTLSNDWKSTGMPERLFHPGYRSEFNFGAWCLRPGMADADVTTVLAGAVALLGLIT